MRVIRSEPGGASHLPAPGEWDGEVGRGMARGRVRQGPEGVQREQQALLTEALQTGTIREAGVRSAGL